MWFQRPGNGPTSQRTVGGRMYAIRVVLGARMQDRLNGQPESLDRICGGHYYAYGFTGMETAVVGELSPY